MNGDIDREALDEELRSFVQEAEYGAEDNGDKAILIEDLWALAMERIRQRSGTARGQIEAGLDSRDLSERVFDAAYYPDDAAESGKETREP